MYAELSQEEKEHWDTLECDDDGQVPPTRQCVNQFQAESMLSRPEPQRRA
jgi:hypothetical protein